MAPESVWEDWIEHQRQALDMMRRKDFDAAFETVTRFLADQDDREIQADVLGFRSEIREAQGRLHEAKQDLLLSHDLSAPATYQRYSLALSLARLSRDLGERGEAISWYIQALETVVKDPLTSGAAAIAGLIEIGHSLSAAEHDLCGKVAWQAWQLFSLPGEPDLDDLPNVVVALDQAASQPVPGS